MTGSLCAAVLFGSLCWQYMQLNSSGLCGVASPDSQPIVFVDMCACLYLQQIQFRRTAKAPVEVAVLCEMADAASADNARILAMLNLSPIISFLFNSEGKLVQANKKGMQKYGHIGESRPGQLGAAQGSKGWGPACGLQG